MSDKTDLIEKVGWYLDRYTDGPTPRERHSEAIIQLCIESDEAREYWKAHYKIDPNMTILGSAHEADIRKQFVEQACEAVDEVFNNGNYVNANRFDVKQAIKDKFK